MEYENIMRQTLLDLLNNYLIYNQELLYNLPAFISSSFNKVEIRTLLAISLGAIGGALSRYYIGFWLSVKLGSYFPWGTIFINLSGCLLMGIFSTLAAGKMPMITPELRLLITTGFLGSYTTLSTYELDTVNLLMTGHSDWAVVYWLGTALVGLIGLELGILIARMIVI